MASDYTDLDAVKAQLEISDDESDSLFEPLITRASRRIDRYCRVWPGFFVATTDTRVFDVVGTGGSYPAITRDYERALFSESGTHLGSVWVDPFVASTLTSLKTDEDGDGVFETTWETSDYVLWPENSEARGKPVRRIDRNMIQGQYWFPLGQRRVQIAADFGYAAAVPADIEEATILEILRLGRRPNAPFGVFGNSTVGFTRIPDTDADVMSILNHGRYIQKVGIR